MPVCTRQSSARRSGVSTKREGVSLELALDADLQAEFADPHVANWRRAMDYEDVRHNAVGLTTVPAIAWINRPTFQQVVQIGH